MLNKLMVTVKKNNMINPGDLVIVGVSGGVDSVALLYALNILKNKLKINLHVAHLNHLFRGQEAKEDAEFVRKLAKEMDLPCTIEEINVPAYIKQTRLSPQEAARNIRYDFYSRILEKIGANKVALAHNANDQAETVLFNFLRGAGLEGLAGIPPVRDGIFIRPIIEVWRSEIEEYCRVNQLATRLDKSNLKNIYTRNKIRLELIPYLEKEFNPSILNSLTRTGEILREENKYFDEIAQEVLFNITKDKDNQVLVDIEKLTEQPIPVQRRVIKKVFQRVNRGGNLEFKHIEELLSFSSKGRSGSQITLPGDCRALKNYGLLIIGPLEKKEEILFDYPLMIPGELKIDEINCVLKAEIIEGNKNNIKEEHDLNVAYLDLAKIPQELAVRNRREGDLFSPLGMIGKKKLKDFLINCKIPREMRNTIPMVASGNQIIWIAGIRISEKWKVTEKTNNLLKIEIIWK